MRRILVCAILISILLGCFGGAFQAEAADDTALRSAKKVISVVYDDSGSMKGDRWVYANYAMQALTALLNEQDQMFITYMSKPGKANAVNTKNLPAAVEDIRKHNVHGETPYQALSTARKALDTVTGQDETTQYWLIIFTDGLIQNLPKSLQDQLDSYKDDKMPNGSALNTVYLTLQKTDDTVAQADPGNGLYTYCAEDAVSITGHMAKISNLISCRITADNVTQVDSTTFTFTSKLPMYSIAVLSQNSTAAVTSGKAGTKDLHIDRNIGLKATEPFKTVDTAVKGNAAMLNSTSGDGIIPAGTCTITFSEEVRLQDLVIQYEPAISLKMLVRKNGVEVTDLSTLVMDEKVDVELIPMIPGTDTEIARQDLPANTGLRVEYLVDGNVVSAKDGNILTDVHIKPGENTFRGVLQIPDFVPLVTEKDFFVEMFVYDPGIIPDQPNPLSYNRSQLSGSIEGGSAKFWITNEGVKLDTAAQDRIGLKLMVLDVKCDESHVEEIMNILSVAKVTCDLERNADGSWTLELSGWPSFALVAGDYTVTVAIESDRDITAQAVFKVIPAWTDFWDILLVILIGIFLILFLWTLLFKRKFPSVTIRREVYELRGTEGVRTSNKVVTLSPLTALFLPPLKASRKKLKGMDNIVVEAGPSGTVIVLGKSIAASAKFFTLDISDPETSLTSILNTLQATKTKVDNKTEIASYDVTLSSTNALYLSKSETSGRVSRYTIVAREK